MTENIIKSPLFDEIRSYLTQVDDNDQIFLYVPYIKTNILEELIQGIQNEITVITNWNSTNLLAGSSELELYPFCVKNKITLYIHDDIHLKVYSINLESAIIGSGNISTNGLKPEGNYEAATVLEKLSNEDRDYLKKIKQEATPVDDDLYKQYKKWYDEHPKPEQIKIEKIKLITKKDHFLKSALPMTRDVDDLIEGYVKIGSNLEPSNNPETAACIRHDLKNYKIESGLSKEEFVKELKMQFLSHPFIQKIDEFINPEAYFGRIKDWIHQNCADDPLPRSWELTENVQVLYDWFVKLGEGKYIVDVPGSHSQRIRKIS